MPRIVFIHPDGREQAIDAAAGESLMQAATSAGVPGIVAECGGSAMCATCHVVVDPSWLDRLAAPLANELEMLECTASERMAGSRPLQWAHRALTVSACPPPVPRVDRARRLVPKRPRSWTSNATCRPS